MGTRIRRALGPTAVALAVGATALWLVEATSADADKTAGKTSAVAKPPDDDANDPLGANAACYVCHMTFVKEELAKVHLKAKVGCIQCHGLSAKHANDENIGATKPDITFKPRQIDASCGECHEGHDAPAKKVVARFVERHLPANSAPICTDCHGQHKIAQAAEKK
jgi:hypothetical protein